MLLAVNVHCLAFKVALRRLCRWQADRTSARRRVVVIGELDFREPWVCIIHESLEVCGWLHVQNQITLFLLLFLRSYLLALPLVPGVTVCGERGEPTKGYGFFVNSLRTESFKCANISER